MNTPTLIFDFELDFAGTLYCIPMCVRLKLDECGIKLSLKQWNRIPPAQRQQLVSKPCGTASEVKEYRVSLIRCIEEYTRSKVEEMPRDPAPEWANLSAPPDRLVKYAQALDVPAPSVQQWAALQPVQRFALFKLTRPGHSNDNFVPAMREFGLIEG